MTPKEKAKELVDKFYIGRSRDNLPLTMYWSSAIGCALIAVDEILSYHATNYWLKVKEEIEKL